jgi:hypothetical protein
MEKECQVIELLNESGVILRPNGSRRMSYHLNDIKSNRHKACHLYIVSDEEIKEGDWLIWNDKVYKHSKTSFTGIDFSDCKKIIATTDPELHLPR